MFRFREPKIKIIYKGSYGDKEWNMIHGVADGYQPQMVEAFMQAVERTKGNININEMRSALEIVSINGVMESIPWGIFESEMVKISLIYKAVFDSAGEKSIPFLPRGIRMNASFNTLNPKSLDYIKDHTGKLIVEITEETRKAVRTIINDAFVEGLHPYESAKEISKIVGLTERQARAVNNLRRTLIIQKLSDKVIEQRTRAYARDLLIYRSRNIARTETITAANMGQQSLWLQSVEQGLLDTATTRRKWITTPDDRLCAWCNSLNGKIVGLEESFGTPLLSGKSYISLTPTLHPHCRCAMGLVFI